MEQYFGSGKAGVDLHPQLFGLLAQPATEVTQADDVVAVVVHLRRGRQLDGLGFGEVQEAVGLGRRVQRRAFFFPVGDQLVQGARLQHGTRQDVGADLGALFQQTDTDLLALLGGQLLQTDGCGQAGRPATDYHHVVFHVFAFHRFSFAQGED